MLKNIFSEGDTTAGSIAPTNEKMMYYPTIAIIHKHFQFQSDWLKIIRFRYSCTQYCPMLAALKKSKISNN